MKTPQITPPLNLLLAMSLLVLDLWATVIVCFLILGVFVSSSKAVVKRDISQAMNPTETDSPNFNFAEDGTQELTDKNFQAEVLRSNFTWLVDFDWPGPTFVTSI